MLTRALNDLKNPKSKTGSLQIIATFTGTTGSMGFVTGQRYELIVRYIRSRGRFEVKTRDRKGSRRLFSRPLRMGAEKHKRTAGAHKSQRPAGALELGGIT